MAFKIDHEYSGIQTRPEVHVYQNLFSGTVPKVNQWEPVVINLVEEIDSEIAIGIANLLRKAEESGQSFVPFFIESPGGSVYGLMSIMESMRRCKIPIYTFTSGIAASCAACIFTAGKRRFMSRYARLLIHDVSVDFSGETTMTSTNIKVEANEMRILNRNIFQIMAENTGQPPNFFVDLVKTKRNNDIYVNAEKALELKLATDIGFPSVLIKHKLTMELNFVPEKSVKTVTKSKNFQKTYNSESSSNDSSEDDGGAISKPSPILLSGGGCDGDEDDDDDDVEIAMNYIDDSTETDSAVSNTISSSTSSSSSEINATPTQQQSKSVKLVTPTVQPPKSKVPQIERNVVKRKRDP